MVEFGVHLTSIPDQATGQSPRDLLDQHRRWLHTAEGALSSVWISDHLQSDDHPILEGWTTLAYLAALAPGYRVGHLVLAQGFRNPALLARMAATLQHLTGGRFVLGIGAGWKAEEYAANDYPFPSAGTRIDQLGEAIDLIRAMWASSPATFVGTHYRVTDAVTLPLPEPPPRILVGGQGPKLMKLAAAKADMWVWDMPIEVYRVPYERLVEECEAIGRDVSEIRLVCETDVAFPSDPADFPEPYWSGYQDFMASPLGPTPDDAIAQLAPMFELGVSEVVLGFDDEATLERFVDEVVPAFK